MIKPQLVLDIGGVLATNLSPLFWQLLAAEAIVSEEQLYSEYKQQISERLWTGQITEKQFWRWIAEYTPNLTSAQTRSFIDRCLLPLPALAEIGNWNAVADIHVLSNHLPAWVEPIITPIKPYLKSITISSEAALQKPHPAIFDKVNEQLPPESFVLFVDDHPKNTKQAALHGWHTLLADEDGRWISQVLPLLKQYSNKK
ncbi:HAD family hydrolase [Paenibacillus sp. MCAF9]|uniref:HAD family hydrolase n=1 Tax=Paenibacillus sp. MCAF9 TaxID=3233046 RepID=UPI003F969663